MRLSQFSIAEGLDRGSSSERARVTPGRCRRHLLPAQAEDAQKAVDRAVEQTQAQKPAAEKIVPHLDRAATIINKAGTVAESAGKIQAAVIKLAPVATALYRLASVIF